MSETSRRKLNFMFHSIEGSGHLNACLGFAQTMSSHGHSISFAINESLTKTVEKFGFRVLPLQQVTESNQGEDKFVLSDNPAADFAKTLQECGLLSDKTPFEKLQAFKDGDNTKFMDGLVTLMIAFNPQIEKYLQDEHFDAYVCDNFLLPPAVSKAKLPWVNIASAAPLIYYQSDLLPPHGSGLSFHNKAEWVQFEDCREETIQDFKKFQSRVNDHFGYVDEEFLRSNDYWRSPYLNVYQYPLELDYTDVDGFTIPDNFVGVDTFVRQDPDKFELPAEFLSRRTGSDKTIYFSMGSMGSFDVELMKKILVVLGKLPYKVIVSKGPRGNEYELPVNCWGENYLPQPAIVEIVDLVITHGGNNTFTETFAAGKKMIVMPLFGDQYDNAQRCQEKGYGIRIEPYSFKEPELVDAIERLMNDKDCEEMLQKAKERIRSSSRREEAVRRVERLVEKYSAK